MQELAALLLLRLAGKDGSSDEITAVITAAGKEVDAAALETLLKEVGDSDINELLTFALTHKIIDDINISAFTCENLCHFDSLRPSRTWKRDSPAHIALHEFIYTCCLLLIVTQILPYSLSHGITIVS